MITYSMHLSLFLRCFAIIYSLECFFSILQSFFFGKILVKAENIRRQITLLSYDDLLNASPSISYMFRYNLFFGIFFQYFTVFFFFFLGKILVKAENIFCESEHLSVKVVKCFANKFLVKYFPKHKSFPFSLFALRNPLPSLLLHRNTHKLGYQSGHEQCPRV